MTTQQATLELRQAIKDILIVRGVVHADWEWLVGELIINFLLHPEAINVLLKGGDIDAS